MSAPKNKNSELRKAHMASLRFSTPVDSCSIVVALVFDFVSGGSHRQCSVSRGVLGLGMGFFQGLGSPADQGGQGEENTDDDQRLADDGEVEDDPVSDQRQSRRHQNGEVARVGQMDRRRVD